MRRMKDVTGMATLLLSLGALTVADSAAAWTMSNIHDFCSGKLCPADSYPQSPVFLSTTGDVYGAAFGNNEGGAGLIYKLTSENLKWHETALHVFCTKVKGDECVDGIGPQSPLITDAQGNFYGTTSEGGKNGNYGVVFQLAPKAGTDRWQLHILYSFCATCRGGNDSRTGLSYAGKSAGAPYDGSSPLYGTTLEGGSNDGGAVFELAPIPGTAKWSEKTLYNFCSQPNCADGGGSYGGVLVDEFGNLFGTTAGGGAHNFGTIFELSPDSSKKHWKYSVLYNFCSLEHCADGYFPQGDLLMDSSQNLVGAAAGSVPVGNEAAGVIFKLAPNGAQSQYSVLYTFCSLLNCADGSMPNGNLIEDAAGNIYGTTQYGGANEDRYYHMGAGTIFELSGTAEQVLYSFCNVRNCKDGEFPRAGIVQDSARKFYGATYNGGAKGAGAAFELSP